jgi:hypothetical protein
LEELQEVIGKAFPKDEMIVSGVGKYYFRNGKNHENWHSYNVTGLPTQSVRDFIPKTFTPTEISKMFFDLIRHIPEGELRKWNETDFESFLQERI